MGLVRSRRKCFSERAELDPEYLAAVGLEVSAWPCSNGHHYSNTDPYTPGNGDSHSYGICDANPHAHGNGDSHPYGICDANPHVHRNCYFRYVWSD